MNGVFKFKENMFLKYKKEIALAVGAVVTMATVVRFVPGDDTAVQEAVQETASEVTAPVAEEVIEQKGFSVMLDGIEIGVIAAYDEGQASVHRAIEMVIAELGYNPGVEPVLALEDNFSQDTAFTSVEDLAAVLKDNVISNLDTVKVKAYVMKIGDDFTVAVKSQEEIKEVLKNAQNIYINSEDMVLDIQLAQDKYNSMVLTPEVTMVREEDMIARSFTAEGGDPVVGAELPEDAGGPDAADVAAADADSAEASEDNGSDGEQAAVEEKKEKEEKPKDPRTDGDTVAVAFAEDVQIVEAYVDEEEIKGVVEATDMITKEKDEPKMYTVESGDVPSIIAENNDMGLSELYKLNPNLKGNERKLQIGDELVVMVPEPELSVATKEEVVYTQPISRGVRYVEDPDTYAGSQKTVDSGYDGILQLTAIVSKVNGDEIDRDIIDEYILKEPKDKVISKGTKPLPAKGATGNYIFPLTEYRITSPFGRRWGDFHYGVDLAAPTGTSVRASDGGRVTIAGWYGTYGYLVEIDHGNGVRTRYGHNSKIHVSVGQEVAQYQQIASVGSTGRSTGPHVHFEIRFDGVCANPMNYLE